MMEQHTVTVHIEDYSDEVLSAMENALERAAMAIGEQAATYAKDNLTRQNAVDTGRLRNSVTDEVKET